MNRHPGSPPPPSEPGPTVAGAYWGGQVGLWSATVNTFSFTPAMVDGLYNPMVTRVGYAETRGLWGMGEACMEVFGDRQWSQPIFYSVPGDGGQVVPWETAETVGTQGPPQAAVGIAPDATTGPDILLYAEGIGDAKVTNATLTGPSGAVAVKVVTPDMPYPASAGGGTVDTHSNIVIPPKPLAPDSSYTLNAVWTDASEANHTQLVRFRTESAQEANDPYRSVCATGCPHGHFGVTIRGGRLRVAISPAVGQRIAVWMWLEHRVCAAPVSPCPRDFLIWLHDRTVIHVIRHYRRPMTFPLPRAAGTQATALLISATTSRFVADGYQWGHYDSVGMTIRPPR